MNSRTLLLISVWAALAIFFFWPQAPDYAYYARTGGHPMLPKYETEENDYIPPFADRLGDKDHWLTCNDYTAGNKIQCAERIGCFTDSDCLEWEAWIERNK